MGILCGGEERSEERVETRVVFPAPWMPLRPIMKGVGEDEVLR